MSLTSNNILTVVSDNESSSDYDVSLSSSTDCVFAKIMGDDNELGEIRSAVVDGEIVVSVYDFVNLVTDHKLGDVYGKNTIFYMKKTENPDVEKQTSAFDYKKHQFPGERQRLTPVFNAYQAQQLMVRLDGKVADKFRSVVTMTFSRVMAGDLSLIDSIIENNQKTDQTTQMYKDIVDKNITDDNKMENFYKRQVDDLNVQILEYKNKLIKYDTKIEKFEIKIEKLELKIEEKDDVIKDVSFLNKDLSVKNNTLKSTNSHLKKNYCLMTDDDDRHTYIVVLRKRCGILQFDNSSETNRIFMDEVIDKRNGYPEWMDDFFKHYIIRAQKRSISRHLQYLKGTEENPGMYPNLEIILNYKDPNSISLVNNLRDESFIKKSYYNHFCVKDEQLLLGFIIGYKSEL